MTIEERERQETYIIDKLPGMTMRDLHLAFYTIYKEVGPYYVKQWLQEELKHS